MDTKRMAKWQAHAETILEPGERVTAVATGTTGGWLFWLFPEISWFRDHARAYLVTDRNVHVCRLRSTRQYEIQSVVQKQRVGQARVQFRRGRLSLDGADPMYVGLLPIGRRWAREVVDAATRPEAVAASADQASR
jgi:hypothetical protein